MGFECTAMTIAPDGVRGYFKFFRSIMFAKEDYVVIRYLPMVGILIFRLLGRIYGYNLGDFIIRTAEHTHK